MLYLYLLLPAFFVTNSAKRYCSDFIYWAFISLGFYYFLLSNYVYCFYDNYFLAKDGIVPVGIVPIKLLVGGFIIGFDPNNDEGVFIPPKPILEPMLVGTLIPLVFETGTLGPLD